MGRWIWTLRVDVLPKQSFSKKNKKPVDNVKISRFVFRGPKPFCEFFRLYLYSSLFSNYQFILRITKLQVVEKIAMYDLWCKLMYDVVYFSFVHHTFSHKTLNYLTLGQNPKISQKQTKKMCRQSLISDLAVKKTKFTKSCIKTFPYFF